MKSCKVLLLVNNISILLAFFFFVSVTNTLPVLNLGL